MSTELGAKIRKARLEAKLTAEQMAPMLGVTMGTLLRWERGETQRISYEQLCRVAEITSKRIGFFTDSKAAA